MNEISCRFVKGALASIRRHGISDEVALAGISRTPDFLRKTRNRIDWDEWVVFCQNVWRACGCDRERYFKVTGAIEVNRTLTVVAGFFVSVERAYRFAMTTMVPTSVSHFKTSMEILPDGSFLCSSRIDRSYTGCIEAFMAQESGLANGSITLGLPPSRVEVVELTPHSSVYRVFPPASRTGLGLLRRWYTQLRGAVAAGTVIRQQNANLHKTHIALEQQVRDFRSVLEASADGIALHRDRCILYANLPFTRCVGFDSPETLIGKALDSWVVPEEKTRFASVLLAPPTAPFTRGQEFHIVATDGRGVTIELLSLGNITWRGEPASLVFLRDITERRELERAISDASAREQRSIARDLHDGLGQNLMGLAFQLKALEMSLERSGAPQTLQVKTLVALANEATEQARSMAHGLAPFDFDALGLVAALQHLTTTTSSLFNVECLFETEGALPPVARDTALQLYRATQEAITNSVRHGRAKRIVVSLADRNAQLELEIDDNGAGVPIDFDPTRSTGMGTRIMRYRMESIGGRFELTPKAQAMGTRVRLAAPVGRLS